MRLLVATGNAHKLEELAELLPGIPLCSLKDFPPRVNPVPAAYASVSFTASASTASGLISSLAWTPPTMSTPRRSVASPAWRRRARMVLFFRDLWGSTSTVARAGWVAATVLMPVLMPVVSR